MIDKSIEELFNSIKESKEYNDYLNIKKELEENKKINNLVEEIKKLQKEATLLESKNDSKYQELDLITEEKVKVLNNIPLYQEYLSKMKVLNDILSSSSKMIEGYLSEKI